MHLKSKVKNTGAYFTAVRERRRMFKRHEKRER